MRIATGLLLVFLALAAGGCSGSGKPRLPNEFPPLPGPKPDAEVVAVSTTIASSDTPVFYVRDADDPHRLIAYDWTGQRRGELLVSSSEPFGVYPSPDGTMILLTHGHIVSGGKAVGKVARGTWAGDNAHLCTFLNTLGGPGAPQERKVSPNMSEGRDTDASLFLEEATTGQLKRVTDFGSFGSHGGPQVLACSVSDDLAIVTQTFVVQESNPEVIRLSDGQVITQLGSEERGRARGFVASDDGSLLAEGSTAGLFGDSFIVRQVPSGEVVAEVSGGGIVAFSGDNTRVLTVKYQGTSNELGEYRVVELATGRVVWSAVLSPGPFLARPSSADFIVASSVWEDPPPGSNTRQQFEDVWLVPATGSARLLLEHSPQIAAD